MAVLRCERLAPGDVDTAVASLGALTLARTPVGAFAEVDDHDVDRARRLLAFAGVRAAVCLETLAPRPGTRAAIGRDLTPLPLLSLALDLVHVLLVDQDELGDHLNIRQVAVAAPGEVI